MPLQTQTFPVFKCTETLRSWEPHPQPPLFAHPSITLKPSIQDTGQTSQQPQERIKTQTESHLREKCVWGGAEAGADGLTGYGSDAGWLMKVMAEYWAGTVGSEQASFRLVTVKPLKGL